ncbi:MAG: hypothetical protein IPN79_00230 [Saprospiraceae bacterium]|nr:hypothetical protein [Saprospiraceae bacterium]
MKTYIIFTCVWLYLFVFTPQVSHSQSNVLGGEYVHVPNSKSIFIERIQNGILYKSKPNAPWVFFEKQRNNLFLDRKGNRIEVVNHDEIIFVKRNSRRGLHFVKIFPQYDENTIPYENNISQRPEGLWFDDQTDTYLVVVETRDGIKVRLKDSRLWYNYQNSGQNNTYFSAEGNSYIWNGQTLEYFHQNNTFNLRFYKIADNFDGF